VSESSQNGTVGPIPAIDIELILGGAYLATPLTTLVPPSTASRVAPAEALRYE
jgi:ABC-type lipoprotein release transport system permease subunit